MILQHIYVTFVGKYGVWTAIQTILLGHHNMSFSKVKDGENGDQDSKRILMMKNHEEISNKKSRLNHDYNRPKKE